MQQLNDDELLESYRASLKSECLAEIFLRYADPAYRTALQFTGNIADAEDIVQISFIKFMRDHHQYKKGTNLRAWLMRIIINTCKDKFREEKQRKFRQNKYSLEKDMNKTETQLIEDNETQKLVKQSLDKLPEKYRTPIWMILYEGFTYPEAATILDLPEKTIRTQVARGLEKLRGILNSYGSVFSIEAITMIMAKSKLEIAPATTKAIIQSPEFYQKITDKNLQSSSESQKILATNNGIKSQFILKLMLSIISFCLIGIVIANYLYDLKDNSINNITVKNITLNKTALTTEANINKIWDFTKIEDRNLNVLMGSWYWNETKKSMDPKNNSIMMVSLPLQPTAKTLMIEIETMPIIKPNTIESKLFSLPTWASKQYIPPREEYPIFEKYSLNANQITNITIYYYNNYILHYVKNKCIRVTHFEKIPNDANPGIILKNYSIYKITAKTLDETPKDLAISIAKAKALTPKKIKYNLIDETQFEFNE